MPPGGSTFDENSVLAWTRGDFRGGFERSNEPTPALRDRVKSSQEFTSAPPLRGRGFQSSRSQPIPSPQPLGLTTVVVHDHRRFAFFPRLVRGFSGETCSPWGL